MLTVLKGIIVPRSIVPIKDCEYKGEHPNLHVLQQVTAKAWSAIETKQDTPLP